MLQILSRPRVLIIGALPPPAIGPYLAMRRLIDSPELNRVFRVEFLDISDRRSPASIGNLDGRNVLLGVRHACACFMRLVFGWPDIVYLGISQGLWGYLRDLTFIVPSLVLQRSVVLHLRGSEFKCFYTASPAWLRWLTRRALSGVARVIVLGQCLKGNFDELVDPGRIVVIPNGIKYQEYEQPVKKSSCVEARRILFLSSLRSRKGVFVLLDALPEVIRQHPDVKVTFAGQWRTALEEQRGRDLVSRLRLTECVHFIGEVVGQDKIYVYQQHDIFVFPAVAPEGMPWVILEAMSAGLPVVSTNQGAIADIVKDGSTGFLVPATASNIAQKLCYLLENPEIAAAMGARGRQRVVEEFSEEKYFQRFVRLFSEVAQSRLVAAAGGDPK